MTFAPIAIVGRGCVLPGALTPDEFWPLIRSGTDLVSDVDATRWRVPVASMCDPAGRPDHALHARGGYVRGFETVFAPERLGLPADQAAALDPLQQWLLHAAGAALDEVPSSTGRRGAVIGHLGFPSASMSAYAESVWTGLGHVDARQRFMSAGSADLLRQTFQLDAGCYCLDAACASSLYALEAACRALQQGRADLMLAGAVQGADDLFLHVGFSALQALSRSGQSRPFHRDADGLLPAEGAVVFALKRLADARRDGDTIHGVIRGIGLSNDGRGRGLLVPDVSGQQQAMRAAYAASGIDPASVDLLECHATGTPVGDGTEIDSSAPIFAAAKDLPIGSLKSNLGHLITTAGAAGLLKVLLALRAGERPPNRPVDAPIDALAASPFRLLQQAEAWPRPANRPRIAAVSAFGFGGNNAHLVVSEDHADIAAAAETSGAPEPVVVVGIGVRAGNAANRAEFTAQVLDENASIDGECREFELDLDGLRLPPRDLQATLPQQLAVLGVAREAMQGLAPLPRQTAVLIGMEPDAEVARYGLRWRWPTQARAIGRDPAAAESIVPALDAAGVLGTMPNIPANRISSQFDFRGPSFTVQSGIDSGLDALAIGLRCLRDGVVDAALVGAVDFGHEVVNQAALGEAAADAALVLVLKRRADALAAGDPIFGELVDSDSGADLPALRPRFGHAGAAERLRDLVAVSLRAASGRDEQGLPRLAPATAYALGLPQMPALHWRADRPIATPQRSAQVHHYAGDSRADVLAALQARRQGMHGAARLALVVGDDADAVYARAESHLRQHTPAGTGVYFREAPIRGDVAFVFAGAGAAYRDMGRALLQDLPSLSEPLQSRAPNLCRQLGQAWTAEFESASASSKLCAASALSQIHLALSESLLGLRADAWIGYSSGETNALIGAGVWSDPDGLMAAMDDSGLMRDQLAGRFEAVAAQWGGPVSFATWTVVAPLAEVQVALAALTRVRLAIIDSEEQCLIAGDAAQCDQLVARIGAARCRRLDYSLAVHMPELRAVAEAWRAIHTLPVAPARHGRVYSTASGEAYAVSSVACAEAVLAQAVDTLDLRRVIEGSYRDGVRIYLEHGPGGSFARAIRSTLGQREALVLSLDRRDQGLDGVLHVAAALWSAGVDIDLDGMLAGLPKALPESTPARRPLRLPGHWPRIDRRAFQRAATQSMAPAPTLPPILRSRPGSPMTQSTARRTEAAARAAAPANVPSHPAPTTRESTSAIGRITPAIATVAAAAQSSAAPVALGLREQVQQLAAIQNQYLELQTQAHQRFLRLRQQAVQGLLAAGGSTTAVALPALDSAPRIAAAPAPVVPPPAPANASAAVAEALEELPRALARKAFPTAPETVTPGTFALDPPIGPQFAREQLLVHADGAISTIFGPAFVAQDGYARQVRMPKPPLLLADRVVGLDAEPMGMGRGTIWTETDVSPDAWYVHQGRMPAGVMIEAGQADLMLISWLGVDQFNRGERVYRLLGCELTYHGDLPAVGDCLRFQIQLDGHAAQGDVRLMFFHYRCLNGGRPQLSVRKGQAGFFTDQELADSAGCLWRAEDQAIVADARLDPPRVAIQHTSFSRAQLEACAAGDLVACFGDSHRLSRTHTRTPTLAAGRMLLFDRVTELAVHGGPWQRGYLRAELDIDPQQWFFEGHFKNDPCMPGTLMFEACLQAMAFYLLACGDSLQRDGWRFQPVPDQPYQLQCRGQVTPRSSRLVTEVFIEERHDGPVPTLYADLLCTVDGLKAFHARRVGLQLVPDWPFRALEAIDPDSTRTVAEAEGFRFDHRALLASADGRPSEAFGPMYRRFDGVQRVARLPSPPYHFMSRIAELHGEIGVMKAGARVRAEYDIPRQAWYFDDHGGVMPFAVLLEAALQPCGWLSSYVGSALTSEHELGFRNLDGEGELFAEIRPGAGILETEVTLTDVSASGGMIIEHFRVECRIGAQLVYRLKTVFGFFPEQALANQAGLPVHAGHRDLLNAVGESSIDLPEVDTQQPALPRGMLRMLDRIEAWWPSGGAHGLGAVRAGKWVDTSEWFFKAHFFQDPVQPGSLGIESMQQAVAWLMRELGLAEGMASPRFQVLALRRAHRWRYRGQVLPKHALVQITAELSERGRDEHGAFALADVSLWVDGQRIYETPGLCLRIVSG